MPTGSDLVCARATPEQRAQAHANVFRDWPHAAAPEEHLRLRLASVHHQRASYYVGLVGGEVVCGLAVFPLTLFGPGGERPAGGIGAVHTREDHRGRGLGSALVRWAIADQARQGASDHLLFSDIDARFYEKLGFVVLPSFDITFAVDPAAADPSIAVEPLASPPALRLEPLGFRFGIARPKEYEEWLHAKYQGKLRSFRVPGGTVTGTVKGERFHLIESDLPQEPEVFRSFAASLAAVAARCDCRRVTAMWTARAPRPDPGHSEIRARKEEILMWASLRGASDPWAAEISREGFRAFGGEHF